MQANITREMDELMWDEESGMHYDLFLNGSRTPFKTVAALYPLLAAVGTNHLRTTKSDESLFAGCVFAPTALWQGMNRTRIARIVETLKSPDFWTAVPVPTVAVSTPDFSTDLDRGPVPAHASLSRAPDISLR